jgi:hypothetical protein
MPGETPGTRWNPSARQRNRANNTISFGPPTLVALFATGGTLDLQSVNSAQFPAKKFRTSTTPPKKARIALSHAAKYFCNVPHPRILFTITA